MILFLNKNSSLEVVKHRNLLMLLLVVFTGGFATQDDKDTKHAFWLSSRCNKLVKDHYWIATKDSSFSVGPDISRKQFSLFLQGTL